MPWDWNQQVSADWSKDHTSNSFIKVGSASRCVCVCVCEMPQFANGCQLTTGVFGRYISSRSPHQELGHIRRYYKSAKGICIGLYSDQL